MEEKTVWNIFKKSPIPEEFCLVEIKKLFKKNVAVIMHIFCRLFMQTPGVCFTGIYVPVIGSIRFKIIHLMWYINKCYSNIIDIKDILLYS